MEKLHGGRHNRDTSMKEKKMRKHNRSNIGACYSDRAHKEFYFYIYKTNSIYILEIFWNSCN
jgi:hypothetical protein